MFIDWSLFRFINWPFTKPHPEYTAGQWQRSTGLAHEQGDFHNCDFFYGVFILLDLAAVTKGGRGLAMGQLLSMKTHILVIKHFLFVFAF